MTRESRLLEKEGTLSGIERLLRPVGLIAPSGQSALVGDFTISWALRVTRLTMIRGAALPLTSLVWVPHRQRLLITSIEESADVGTSPIVMVTVIRFYVEEDLDYLLDILCMCESSIP